MKKGTGFMGIAVAAALLAAAPAFAEGLDGSRPLLCALSSVFQCEAKDACSAVTLESVALPPFLKVDFAAKTVTQAGQNAGKKEGEIASFDRVGGRLILQGADGGPKAERRGLGWTASIAQDTGKMVLSVAAVDAGFVIFGACLAQ